MCSTAQNSPASGRPTAHALDKQGGLTDATACDVPRPSTGQGTTGALVKSWRCISKHLPATRPRGLRTPSCIARMRMQPVVVVRGRYGCMFLIPRKLPMHVDHQGARPAKCPGAQQVPRQQTPVEGPNASSFHTWDTPLHGQRPTNVHASCTHHSKNSQTVHHALWRTMPTRDEME